MSLKSTLEDNVVIFFIGALITGFVTGWGAYSAIQSTSGLTPVPTAKAKLLDGELPDKLFAAESEVSSLRKQLLQNLPAGKTYVSNIVLSPQSPGELIPEEHIVVDFDYVVAPGRKVRIFTEPYDATSGGSYQPSPLVEGMVTPLGILNSMTLDM